jgi:hypothetical protein
LPSDNGARTNAQRQSSAHRIVPKGGSHAGAFSRSVLYPQSSLNPWLRGLKFVFRTLGDPVRSQKARRFPAATSLTSALSFSHRLSRKLGSSSRGIDASTSPTQVAIQIWPPSGCSSACSCRDDAD